MIYQQHPLSAIFPPMSANELQDLADDIASNGQREPCIKFDGMILDGWHRYQAAIIAGVEPQVWDMAEGLDPASYVLSQNLHRRHLAPGQRAAIVSRCQDWQKAQTVGKPKSGKSGNLAPLGRIQDRARVSGTSERTQKAADKVAKASPELAKQVASGEVSLPNAVAQVSKPKKPRKPKKAPQASVASAPEEPAYDPKEDELSTARELAADLAAENEALKDRLAVEVMAGTEDDRTSAANTISELRERVRLLEIENQALKDSRDSLMVKVAEMTRQLSGQRKALKKLNGGDNVHV